MDGIKDIERFGKASTGKRYLIRHLKGEKITLKQAILSKCFDCCGFYVDGKHDCLIPECPLYPFMPYRLNKEKIKKIRTEKQIEQSRKLTVLRSGSTKKPMLQECLR